MKRIFSCLVLLLITTSFVVTAYADFQNPAIVDDAGYLMQSELASLSKELDEVREKYGFEVAIYTESDMTSSTAEASADEAIAAAKSLEKIADAINGMTIVKELYVKGRLVNIVVRP